MTLDEAIIYAEEVAKKKFRKATSMPMHSVDEFGRTNEQCEKCAEEHRQLAEWLKLLKRILDSGDCNTCALLHSQCRYAPRLGEQVRYNCPFFAREEGEGE